MCTADADWMQNMEIDSLEIIREVGAEPVD